MGWVWFSSVFFLSRKNKKWDIVYAAEYRIKEIKTINLNEYESIKNIFVLLQIFD